MTTIRKIVTSKIDGSNANNTDIDEIRPFGETAFYIDNNGPTDQLVLSIHDGVRTHQKSKVLGPGVLYGSNADAGDGSNADTIKLIPDASLGTDQYIVVDPTGGEPGHIHLRAGGLQDQSFADLYLGGELTNVRVSDTSDDVVIRTSTVGEGVTPYQWLFDNTGKTIFPGGMAITGIGATVQAITGNDINIETNDLQTISANCAIAVGDEFVADTEFNDDITVVQVGWTVTIDFNTYVVTSIDPAPPANQYRITATGATFVQGVNYTFTNPAPITKTWSFGSTGVLTTPGLGTITHQNNDLKLEVSGTDVIVLRTGAGELVVNANGSLTASGDITVPVGYGFKTTDAFQVTAGVRGQTSDVYDTLYIHNNRSYIYTNWAQVGTGGQKAWAFNEDGSITFPDASSQTTAYTGLYTPATPSDWNGTPPTTIAAAIDRLAARIKLIDGGTGA